MHACFAAFFIEGGHVAERQIDNVDIVAHAGAIGSGVVVAEYGEFGQFAGSHLANVGQQIIRNTVGLLADAAAGVCADGVEITQQNHTPLRVGRVEVGHHALHHLFGCAIGIGGFADGGAFGNRHGVRVTVHGGGGAEHDAFHARALHFFQQDKAA